MRDSREFSRTRTSLNLNQSLSWHFADVVYDKYDFYSANQKLFKLNQDLISCSNKKVQTFEIENGHLCHKTQVKLYFDVSVNNGSFVKLKSFAKRHKFWIFLLNV